MDLVNGSIVYTMKSIDNIPVSTVATYTCDPGYTLNGGTTRTCGSGERWSGSDPTCKGWWQYVYNRVTVLSKQINSCFLLYIYTVIMCPPLPTITNGTISYSPDVTSDYDLGTIATYTCEAGFYLEGNEVRVCMDDDGMDVIGLWSGQEPSCVCTFCVCFARENLPL